MIVSKTQNSQISFTGYDARRLHGFIMTSPASGVAQELQKIGEIENFKVYLLELKNNRYILRTDHFDKVKEDYSLWAQDYFSIIKDTLLFDPTSGAIDLLMKIFKLKPNKKQAFAHDEYKINELQARITRLLDLPQKTINGERVVEINVGKERKYLPQSQIDAQIEEALVLYKNSIFYTHVKGGNFFVTRGSDGADEILIGADELKAKSIDDLKEMFQTSKIHVIPQADFHLDLFIRPLAGKKVLVADDRMMVDVLKRQAAKLKELSETSPPDERDILRNLYKSMKSAIKDYEKSIANTFYATTDEVVEALEKSGYTPIRVPGRFFTLLNESISDTFRPVTIQNLHNYLNAQVLVNDKGELAYITNKSTLEKDFGLTSSLIEKIGISLEETFKSAIEPYVKKVYFVSGKNDFIGNTLLPEQFGGLHCITTEVPAHCVPKPCL